MPGKREASRGQLVLDRGERLRSWFATGLADLLDDVSRSHGRSQRASLERIMAMSPDLVRASRYVITMSVCGRRLDP